MMPLSRPISDSQPAPRRAGLAWLAFGVVLALALAAATLLWARFGTALFFEMIAAGIAACF